jgi:O-antigen/teichoic acid export membrane protein
MIAHRLQGVLVLVLGNAAFMAAAIAGNALVTQELGVEGLGHYGFLVTAATIVSIPVVNGVPHLLSQAVSANPQSGRSLVTTASRMQGVRAFAAMGMLVGFGFAWSLAHGATLGPWGAGAAIVAGYCGYQLVLATLNGLGDTRGQAGAMLVVSVVRVVGTFVGASLFGLVGALVGLASALVIGSAWVVARAWPRLGSVPIKEPNLSSHANRIAMATALTAILASIEVIVVRLLASAEASGDYYAAWTLGRLPFYGAMAVASFYYPIMTLEPGRRALRVLEGTAVILVAGVILATGFWVVGDSLLGSLFGSDAPGILLVVLTLASTILGIGAFLGAILAAQRDWAHATVGAILAFSVGGTLIFIWGPGPIAIALASLAGAGALAITTIIGTVRVIRLRTKPYPLPP